MSKKYSFAILAVESEAGYEGIAELLNKFGKLPDTPTLKGPNGSVFYFFRLPAGPCQNVELAPHVKFWVDGNYEGVLPAEYLDQVEERMKPSR